MSKKMPEEKPREEAGEEQDSGAQTKPGKKKMLVKLGVIALAVVVLAGGGFFAYQKFLAKGSRGNAKHDRPAEKKRPCAHGAFHPQSLRSGQVP